MQKKQKGHYFDKSGNSASPILSGEERKGRSRKEIESESRLRKFEERMVRDKERIKREVRRVHISSHKEENYDILEKWDRESKLAVYSILVFKVFLVVMAVIEVYSLLVHQSLYFF